MSRKKNYSSLELSPFDLPVENTEPARKRRKSQEEIIAVDSDFTNDSTTLMAAVDDEIKSMDVPSPKDDRPEKNGIVQNTDQKQVRYDRQLRLWGDHGQALLEVAQVCVLNATATGTEILKSLVLSGIGAFTVVDGGLVTGADVGANFFLEKTSIGQSRAKVACEFLQELNSDVRGNYVSLSPDEYVTRHDFSVLDQFSVVIGTNLSGKGISALSGYLFKRGIPFVICRCNGLIGYLRLLVKEHPVIESHPDNPLPNFMLEKPFPELTTLVSSINLNTLDHKDHSHTPYLILLFKALDIWREKKSNLAAYPRTYKEKKEIKEILSSMRQPDDKGNMDEENFQEAINAVNTAFAESPIPQSVRDILSMESANSLTKSSSNFWILCHAVRRFIGEYGRLPIRGTVPDMISDSKRYIQLQNVFLRKAEADAAIVHSYTLEAATPFSRGVSTAETRLFCKNAAFIRLLRSNLPPNEDHLHCGEGNGLAAELRNEDAISALWYLVLVECEGFFDVHGRYPGSSGEAINDDGLYERDVNDLTNRVDSRIKKLLGNEGKVSKLKEAAEETCRYAGSELHAVASFLGGAAAHEVIKLITHQYVPVNNTYIFDGNTGQGSVIRLG